MARRRISVERIKEVIRYGVTTDLSERAIGRALKVSRIAVAKYLECFRAKGMQGIPEIFGRESHTDESGGTFVGRIDVVRDGYFAAIGCREQRPRGREATTLSPTA